MLEAWVASGIELTKRDLPLTLHVPSRRWYFVRKRGYQIDGIETANKIEFSAADLKNIGLSGYLLANEMLADAKEML